MEKRRLNLGCGDVFHTDWINIDVLDLQGKLLKYNLNLGVPFCDDTFDFVYHSHILEHFTHKRGRFFLEECFRVLKEGGILRIAFPDLEAIARNYVQALDDIEAGKQGAQARRRWMTIELYDQIAREKSGGEMLEYLQHQPVQEADFIIGRMGKDFAQTIEFFKNNPSQNKKEILSATTTYDSTFKNCGELHQWMYDCYALKETLEEIGFTEINRVEYNTSCSEDYLKYHFDSDNEGHIRKPDSAFIEAVKPYSNNNEKKIKIAIFNALDHGKIANDVIKKHKALRKIGIKSQMYTGFQKNADNAIQIVPIKGNGFVNGENGEVYLESFLKKLQGLSNQTYESNDHVAKHDDCFNLNDIMFIDDFDIINLEQVAYFADPMVHPKYYQNKNIVWNIRDASIIAGEEDLNIEQKENFKNLNLHIVTPSNWVANEVRKSVLLRNFPISVIRNSVPLETYKPLDRERLRVANGITPNDIILLLKADDFSNPYTGTQFAIETLKKMAQTELASRLIVLVLGNNAPKEFLDTGIRVQGLAPIENENEICGIYNIADALLVTSLENYAPCEIAESLACGTPVVSFSNGEIPELILHGITGWLAKDNSTDNLCAGIKWLSALSNTNDVTTQCRNFALENFDETKQAKQYEKLEGTS